MILFVKEKGFRIEAYEGELRDNVYVKKSGILGLINDSCCYSNVKFSNLKPIIFYNVSGQGGFVKKGEFITEMTDAWLYINDNVKLQELLKKSSLTIQKKDIPFWKREVDKRL
jgi:hypothetical protein